MSNTANTSSSSPFHPVLHYDFAGVSSTIVPDISGSGSAGVIRGHDRGGAYLKQDIVFGQPHTVLQLTGGQNGGYLQLPDGILNNGNGITVSFFCKVDALEGYGTLCSFGKDNCLYLSALPDPEREDRILISPGATKGGRSQEAAVEPWVPVRKKSWFHVIITMDANLPCTGNFYVDGQPAGAFSHRRMDSKDLCGCTDCYVGYGSLSRCALSMCAAQLLIYPCIPESGLISSLFHIADETRMELEFKGLEPLFMETGVKNLILPSTGSMGAELTWKSLTPELVSDSGALFPPACGQPDGAASLEASAVYRGLRVSHVFSFRVPAAASDQELARQDLDALVFPFPGHVTDSLTLPTKGKNGSVITWESGRPEILDGLGRVTRPPKPSRVTLTAAAVYQKACETKRFSFTVLPCLGQKLPADKETPYGRNGGEHNYPCVAPAVNPAPPVTVDFQDSGLFYRNRERCLNYLLLLDTDRMLYNFRKTFRQDTKGALPLGGWEEPAGLLRGHSTGHYLSALAFAFSSTKEEIYRHKADYLIRELRSMQMLSKGDPAAFQTSCSPSSAAQSLWSKDPSEWGEGFLSAYSPDQFALLEQFTPYATIWAPYYTLHKLLAGFLDCYIQMQSDTALQCAEGIGGWVCSRLSSLSGEKLSGMWSMYIAGEYGGMNESMALLYRITGKEPYLKAARMFDNPVVFDGLSEGRDTISGIHANQHIPQIIGAIEEYEATGEPYYYNLARSFWHLVTKYYLYSIGGMGRGENFKEPDILAGNIEGDRNCETCAVYNMLKLTSKLSRYEPDNSVYMDYYERAMINQIAASQNPVVRPAAHHGVTYMLPIGPGARRQYSNDYEDFTCCHGTGMENHVRYSENIYQEGTDGESLYVNLFLSSRHLIPHKNLTVIQKAPFPGEESILSFEGHDRLELHIRIPYWCREGFGVSLNGAALPPAPEDAGYYVLEREFESGDELRIALPYRLHLCYTQDMFEGMPAASVMYGPLVMAAHHEGTEWLTLRLMPDLEDSFEIERGEMPLLWYDDLKFLPMYAAHNIPYHTYFKIDLV